jgi:heptosyltransferase II
MKRLKDWDPHTPVVLACRPGLGEFFKHYGLCDEFVAVDKRAPDRGRAALDRLMKEKWNYVFVPHESVRTALWMRRLRADCKVGFKNWWNGFVYNKRVVRPVEFPDALRQLSLLTAVDERLAERFASDEVQSLRNLKSQSSPVDFTAPRIPDWASMQVMQHQPSRRVVFLAPGSTWGTKRWTVKGYEELARMLIMRGYDVDFVGSRAERELCDEIERGVKKYVRDDGPQIFNHAGETSLAALVKLLSGGEALVSNDSGAMHAAAAAGLPTVAVFGPTTLELGFRPWQNRAIVVQRELKCRPCGKHGPQKCPIGTHECMKSISAGEVMRALETLL